MKKKAANVASKKRAQTAKRIIEAIEKSHGFISLTADIAGVHRRTVERYVKDFPSVAEAIQDARENLFDTVESKLYEKIMSGDLTAIIFFLKTRCKHRGYTEKQIETPKDVTFRVVYDDELKGEGE